jgi:hypothetical protein
MTQEEQVIQAITDFVRGGDTSDIARLDKVLHPEFRVTNNGFMGKPGVTIIDKPKYLLFIKDGTFGGNPREMHIEQVDVFHNIAMVKLRLKSAEFSFVSYNSLVQDATGEWTLINNLAFVEPNAGTKS